MATRGTALELLSGIHNDALESLCYLAFWLCLSKEEDQNWSGKPASRRRYLSTVEPAKLRRMIRFLDEEQTIEVPGRHADRLRQMPDGIKTSVFRAATPWLPGLELEEGESLSLDYLLTLPEESKLLFRWAVFERGTKAGARAGHPASWRAARGREAPRESGSTSRSTAETTMRADPPGFMSTDDVDSLFPGVGGLRPVKQALYDAAYLPMKRPDLHARYGLTPERGILLHGPPGNGKTEIARQLAASSGWFFRYIDGPELLTKWMGDTEAALRKIFAEARKREPALIFFDELDVLGARRQDSDDSGMGHVQQLLSLTDGLTARGNIVVVGATNRLHAIDPALLRPGRFGVLIEVPDPEEQDRATILRIHLGNKPLHPGVNLPDLARRTEGFSGAALMALCGRAARAAMRRELATTKRQLVTHEDMLLALG